VQALRTDGRQFPAEVRLSCVHTPRGPIVTALVRDLSGSRLSGGPVLSPAGCAEASPASPACPCQLVSGLGPHPEGIPGQAVTASRPLGRSARSNLGRRT
jgi:hypothetical protein